MAKQRRTNTAASALGSLLSAIGTVAAVELKDNPEALAEVSKMVAGVKDSNYITAAEHLDDSIETKHQVDEILEQANIDPVQHGRDGALVGANATVAIEQATQGDAEQVAQGEQEEQAEQDETEQEVGQPPAENK